MKTHIPSSCQKKYQRLLELIQETEDISAALALLDWDQETYMPRHAADGRAAQAATLSKILHEKETAPEYEALLQEFPLEVLPPESPEAYMIRELRKSLEQEKRIPASLVGRMAEQEAKTQNRWLEAKEKSDYRIVQKELGEMIRLKQEYTSLFPEFANPYDCLLDEYEDGMTCQRLEQIFEPVRQELPVILQQIMEKQKQKEQNNPDDLFRNQRFDPERQMDFCRKILTNMGYNWNQGRLDLTEHPFTTSFGLQDVRITTKILENNPLSCLFSCIHEGGHALYEQNIDPVFNRTPMADGASLGFHESQSRLWENFIGRSEAFWTAFYPAMQKCFPEQLNPVSLNAFMTAVNQVVPSMIRTEADEVTYNLHILLRYDLEKAIFLDHVSVTDLPELWRQKMKQYLNIVPANDREGILQDVHWYCGLFGYFPTYALGNLIAAALMEKIQQESPQVLQLISQGKLQPLKEYLCRELYCSGASASPADTWKRLFGPEPLTGNAFLRYLKQKYLK